MQRLQTEKKVKKKGRKKKGNIYPHGTHESINNPIN
jgi:hypothetical protein